MRKIWISMLCCVGLFTLNAQQQINIFGVVLDEVTGRPIPGVKVFFQNESGKIIYEGNTNQNGYFNLATQLAPGREISIELWKNGYRRFNRKYFIKDRDNGLEIALDPIHPALESPDQPSGQFPPKQKQTIWDHYISGYVKTRFRGAMVPVPDVEIEFELNGKRYDQERIFTDDEGFYIIYFNFRNGDEVTVYFRHPDYKPAKASHRFIEEQNGRSHLNKLPDLPLNKKPEVNPGFVATVAGGTLILGGAGMKLISSGIYNEHTDVTNYANQEDWMKDYDRANGLNKTSIYLMIGGATVLAGWGAYKLFFKKKEKEVDFFSQYEVRKARIQPIVQYQVAGRGFQAGLNITF